MRKSDALVIAGLVAVGVLAWVLQLRPPLVADPISLDAIPLELGVWRGEVVPVPSDVDKMLRADHHIQRAYLDVFGDVVWLYVGYYGTERGGRPEHTPWQCYPSHGWKIVEHSVVTVDPPTGLRANEILVDKDGQLRIVQFWYQSYRRTGMLGGLDQALDRLVGQLLRGRADGSLVRLSTTLRTRDDVESARLRLRAFARELEPHLIRAWPAESAASL